MPHPHPRSPALSHPRARPARRASRARRDLGLWTAALLVTLAGCGKQAGSPDPATQAAKPAAEAKAVDPADLEPIDKGMLGAFGKLPAHFDSATNPPTAAKLHLGHLLYFDKRLSRSGTLACNSCHKLDAFGVDGEPTSPGHAGERGDRNSPTVFNAAGQFRQFWDGREPDVEGQAKGPVLNPVEHGLKDAAEVEQILAGIPGYVDQFKKAFPEDGDKAVSFDNFAKAVGAFERKLVTPAPWDRFLAGEVDAITLEQKKGARLFVTTGCVSCHNGALLGGTTYQKLGKVKPWPRPADPGRKKVTGKDADLHMFKVPSLRNVAKTGPYFHDGKTAELGEAVRLMATHQLGKTLSDSETGLLVAFLRSLTGEPPAEWIATPKLPASGAAEAKGEGAEPGAAPTAAAPAKPAAAAVAPKDTPEAVPHAPPGEGSAPEPQAPGNEAAPPVAKPAAK